MAEALDDLAEYMGGKFIAKGDTSKEVFKNLCRGPWVYVRLDELTCHFDKDSMLTGSARVRISSRAKIGFWR